MHLISPLMSGMNGAQSGSARVFRRGTSTRATWYSSFEGDGADSTGLDITLDSNGRAEVYVDEYVDVSVLDAQGVQVANFTAGYAASAVEYTGQSFTGTDYDSAISGASNPVSVQAVLNRWKDSAGTLDFQVLFDGAASDLQTVLGRLLGLVYNVKGPPYNATGDGVADDTTSIQAAIDAAETAGGGIVFLPQGTYRTTDTLDIKSGVSVIGAGPEVTNVSLDTATATLPMWDATEASNQYDLMAGISGRFLQSNTSTFVDITAAAKLRVRDCEFDTTTSTSAVCFRSTVAHDLHVENCELLGKAASLTHASTNAWFERCLMKAPDAGVSQSIVTGLGIHCHRCKFDTSAVTSDTTTCYEATSGSAVVGSVEGCVFTSGGGATIVGIDLGAYTASSTFYEGGCVVPGQADTAFQLYEYGDPPFQASVLLETRQRRTYVHQGDENTIDIDARQWGVIVWIKTGTTNINNFNPSNRLAEGHETVFLIDADAGTIASVGSGVTGVTSHSMNANNRSSWVTRSMKVDAASVDVSYVAVTELLDQTG